MFNDTFRDSTVWVSGHTGFKGAWLCEWLLLLGARVHGYALAPPTEPALFDQLGLAGRIARHEIGDIRDREAVAASIASCQPDFVFHFAAQSLVRPSYREPVETFSTNVMGTVHVLEALRAAMRPCAAVFVTTDKIYENREWVHAYRECDPLGGRDPYSASKAASEHAIAAYRASYFSQRDSPVRIASARAGNVIGGGDWAEDRIVPDCIRALSANRPILVRNPCATRPWQHVLEPLSGYLKLAVTLAASSGLPLPSFNFGPAPSSNRPVSDLVDEILSHWPGHREDAFEPGAMHEAGFLNLATEQAFHLLRWHPVWNFRETIETTVAWYRAQLQCPDSASELTRQQLATFSASAAESSWW